MSEEQRKGIFVRPSSDGKDNVLDEEASAPDENEEEQSSQNQKSDPPGPKPGWNVFVSEVAKTHLFTCAMMRVSMDQLNDQQKNEVNRICELFQSSVLSVVVTTTKGGSTIEIKSLNLQDPETDNLLWTQIRALIDADSSAYVEIHNLNHHGQDISVERYMVSNIILQLKRDYSRSESQVINIAGNISSEVIAE